MQNNDSYFQRREASNAASQFSMSASWRESYSCRVIASGMDFMIVTPPENWGARKWKRPFLVTDKRAYYREEYLNTDHWKQLKGKKLKDTPYCQSCGKTKSLDAHHVRYKNLYDVTCGDLLTLCRSCHEIIHTWMIEHKFDTWDGATKQTGLPPHMRPYVDDYQI